MALDVFRANVRRAVRLDGHRSVTDAPRLDPGQLVAEGTAWLTPRTVAGYEPADFGHLDPGRREGLDQQVRAFLDVTSRTAPDSGLDQAGVDSARAALRSIAQELEFDRFADAEAYRVGRMIEGMPHFPRAEVADARYLVRPDSNGEPSVKIMVYLTEGDREQFPDRAVTVRRIIADLVLQSGLPYWPYVSTREASDLAELQTVEAAE